MWKIQHPNGVREINELHLPKGRAVKITGTSEDVIHDFGIPAFRNKIDVVPGRYVDHLVPADQGRRRTTSSATSTAARGTRRWSARSIVMEAEDYDAWLDGQVKNDGPNGKRRPDGSPAWEGRKLFLKLQCITCHNNIYDADKDNPNTSNRAPNLEGLYKSIVPLQGGGRPVADEQLHPRVDPQPDGQGPRRVEADHAGLPAGQVSEEELINLVAYIKSLQAGRPAAADRRVPGPGRCPDRPDRAPGRPAPKPNDKPKTEGGHKK